MSGPLKLYNYVSDNGTTYHIRLDETNASAVGADEATPPAVSDKPQRMRPRYLLARHPDTGRQTKVVCPDPTHGAWLGSVGTLSLHDGFVFPSAAVTYTIQGRIGEKRYA